MKVIWVDLLCFSSAFKLLGLIFKTKAEKVNYVNIVKSFTPCINILEKLTKAQFSQVTEFIESDEYINNVSIYEVVQRRLIQALEGWTNEDRIKLGNQHFCSRYGFNQTKFNEHIKEAAYPHVFRPIEMSALASKISKEGESILLIRKSPFVRLINAVCKEENVVYYSTLFSHLRKIENRKQYYYDAHFNKRYFGGKYKLIARRIVLWFLDGINSILTKRRLKEENQQNIAIELTQSRIRLDEINDLTWVIHSNINKETIYGIEFEEYEKESVDILESSLINRVRYLRNSFEVLKRLIRAKTDMVTARRNYIAKTFTAMLRLWFPLIFWNEAGWLRFQQTIYRIRVEYWRSVYEKYGIRILTTMYDIDDEKLVKAQAIELLDGITVSGHWSNLPMYRVDNQKCCDVLLTWGEHFRKNIFKRYPHLGIFDVGYPSDHYFIKRRERAGLLRNKYRGKFILSYHDNVMANDLAYSKKMQVALHKMFLELLDEFEDLVVFLKPKRKFIFSEIFEAIPQINQYIEQKRLAVFFGDTSRTKAVPAEIGLASDLVVGLGISTTAAECFFAGTLGFHADFTGFTENDFANKGLGTIVFRDIDSLKEAINKRITKENHLSYDFYNQYYKDLDSFQDGKSYERIEFIIRTLQEYLKKGHSRQEVVRNTQEDYSKLVNEIKKEKLDSAIIMD